MNKQDPDRLLILGNRVQRAKTIIDTAMTEMMEIVCRIGPLPPGAGAIANLIGSTADPSAMFDRPIVDTVAMTVTWRGKRCPLGYTRLFDLIERLARNPGRWVPYERLLREVWNDEMLDDGAIKVAMTRLKAKLADHGMKELAEKFHTGGYKCGYFPEGLLE